jgi:hypothetical protein
LAIREVADEVGISRGSANTILTGNWQLHHDNAPAHSSHLIQGFLAKHGIPQVRQAPYSPDMAPCDFWLFQRLKTPLKGCRFASREDIIQNATAQLHAIPKEAFQNCFQRWKDRWAKCVDSQGAYFPAQGRLLFGQSSIYIYKELIIGFFSPSLIKTVKYGQVKYTSFKNWLFRDDAC